MCVCVCVCVFVNLDHKTSHKGQFSEIEIYTSESWKKLSINVWFKTQLFDNLESEEAKKSKHCENRL